MIFISMTRLKSSLDRRLILSISQNPIVTISQKVFVLFAVVSVCGCVTLPSEIVPDTNFPADLPQVASCEEIRISQYAISMRLATLVERQMDDRIQVIESSVRATPKIVAGIAAAKWILGPAATVGAPIFLLGEPIYAFLRKKDVLVSEIAVLKAVLIQLEELALKNGCS